MSAALLLYCLIRSLIKEKETKEKEKRTYVETTEREKN